MKKAYVLFSFVMLMCFTTLFVGCGKDDDDDPTPTQTSLVGTWTRTYTETEDGLTYSFEDRLVFNADGTGYNSETESISSRAGISSTETDYFMWKEGVSADNIRYVEIIHTGGDEIIGNGRFTFTLISNKLNLFGVTYTKR